MNNNNLIMQSALPYTVNTLESAILGKPISFYYHKAYVDKLIKKLFAYFEQRLSFLTAQGK